LELVVQTVTPSVRLSLRREFSRTLMPKACRSACRQPFDKLKVTLLPTGTV